jgi:hypothetical protein
VIVIIFSNGYFIFVLGIGHIVVKLSDTISSILYLNKRERKPKGQLRIDNPEIRHIGHTQYRTKTNKTQHSTENRKMSNTDTIKNWK